MTAALPLPAGVTVFERGWLSANNILLVGPEQAALVDSGYCSHADQTLQLVRGQLGARPLDLLANTHLHSDHCGGNAALQSAFPTMQTRIPPGHAQEVARWDADALSYAPTGQNCPRFRHDGVLLPGTTVHLGAQVWEIHAAPGHDPHSVILFEPQSRTLMSADALWQAGFGVVFPELEGIDAFADVGRTLDLIEDLQPRLVIPGHGSPFNEIELALASARRRLDGFATSPQKHVRYAAKVLLKFKLLEVQRFSWETLLTWSKATPYLRLLHATWGADVPFEAWLRKLAEELEAAGAARLEGDQVINV